MANVALANLIRGRYGIKLYDNQKKQYVALFDPFISTNEVYPDSGLDKLFTADHKNVKYFILHTK